MKVDLVSGKLFDMRHRAERADRVVIKAEKTPGAIGFITAGRAALVLDFKLDNFLFVELHTEGLDRVPGRGMRSFQYANGNGFEADEGQQKHLVADLIRRSNFLT